VWDDDEAARQEGEMTMRDGEALAAEGTLAGLEAEEAGGAIEAIGRGCGC